MNGSATPRRPFVAQTSHGSTALPPAGARRRRRLVPALFALAAAWAPLPAAAQAGGGGAEAAEHPAADESTRLRAWFDQVFHEELRYNPVYMTMLGMIDDLEAYGEWGDFSDAGERAAFERTQRRLAEMRTGFDFEALDEAARLSYRLFEFDQETAARQFAVRESAYVFSPIMDMVSFLASFLVTNHRVDVEAHAGAYLSRLEGLGGVIDELVDRAEARAAAGVRLPLFAYPRLSASGEALLRGAPFEDGGDGVLLADFRAKVDALDVDAPARSALVRRAEAALSDGVGPALERYLASLAAMEAEADDRVGAWTLPNGADFYAAQIELFTTRPDLTPEAIHAVGLAQVERIRGEIEGIMAEVGFDGSVDEFLDAVAADPRFAPPGTPEERQAYLDEAAGVIDRMMEATPEYFGVLPRAALQVRSVEPFREATAPGAFYEPPALDGSRPGYYYVNFTEASLAARHLLESLAYHEGAPGHHFQIALAMEQDELPLFQRIAGYSAFAEGWGLYAERLGKDMGFFTDPYQDLGRLDFELFRAVRLVVDTGIHHYRWTRGEAIEYVLANTSKREDSVIPEVDRYIAWPGQAVSYMMGMLTILDLRERAMAELGEDFSWAGFHDAVLTGGTLPLPLVEQRVDQWIRSVGSVR